MAKLQAILTGKDTTLNGQKISTLTASGNVQLEQKGENINIKSSTELDSAVKWRTNPNLLDNWYFGNPVNQKNIIESTTASYVIDRWKMEKDVAKITVEEDGLLFDATSVSAGNGITFYQPIEANMKKGFKGKKMTASILYTPITSRPGRLGHNANTSYVNLHDLDGQVGKKSVASGTFTVPETASDAVYAVPFWLFLFKGGKAKIHAVKVEFGDQQTLAHQENNEWVLNEIPDFREQLAKCQKYTFVLPATQASYPGVGIGSCVSNTGVAIHIPTPVTMRSSMTITMTGKWFLRGGGKINSFTIGQSGVTAGIQGISSNEVTIAISGLTNLPSYQTMELERDNNTTAQIILNANI